MRKLKLRLARMLPQYLVVVEVLAVSVCSFVISAQPAYAADVTRLLNRSLLVGSSEPGVVTNYKVSFTHNTQTEIGSVDMLFCVNPIPDDPCNPPPGLDVSNAVLGAQTGETGYSISVRTPNHIVLSRTPSMTSSTPSSYTLENILNPTYTTLSYSIRLSTYASSDASGPIVDLGSVITKMVSSIQIETQVPPILIFCLAQEVEPDCEGSSGGFYSDMGNITPDNTLSASSQMAVSTNASGGFAITVNGTTMQAGEHTIKGLDTPTASFAGVSQFGLNLRANTTPQIGNDPEGPWPSAVPTADYNTPDRFKFKDGDTVASSPDVVLMRRFTTSYIVNAPADLRAGVYTTTLTYICSGRF